MSREKGARLVLWSVALAFLAAGIWRGDPRQVFAKAVRVCMECIGIG